MTSPDGASNKLLLFLLPYMKIRNPKAFTLIELLTVIAIIGILAAIIIPVTGSVREQGRVTQCRSNLRQIVMSMELYAQNSRGFYPAIGNTSEGFSIHDKLMSGGFLDKNPKLFICPSKEISIPLSDWPLSYYGINRSLCPDGGTSSKIRRRQSDIENPSRVAIFVDAPSSANQKLSIANWGVGRDISDAEGVGLHKKRSWLLFAFADGHIAYMNKMDVNRNKPGADEFWGFTLPSYTQ